MHRKFSLTIRCLSRICNLDVYVNSMQYKAVSCQKGVNCQTKFSLMHYWQLSPNMASQLDELYCVKHFYVSMNKIAL